MYNPREWAREISWGKAGRRFLRFLFSQFLGRMRKKHYTRQRVRKLRQDRRRYPFDENTMICQLYRPECFCRINRLEGQLHDYLDNNQTNLRKSKGIFLSKLGKETIKRSWLYAKIKQAIADDKDGKSPLKISRNAFFRFLASSHHSNIGLSEASLKAAVNKAIRETN